MASPLGHSLIGLMLARSERATSQTCNRLAWYAFAVFAANVPDLDFLPGLFLDEPFRFHRGPAHSLLAACAFGGLVYLLALRTTPRAGTLAALGFSCYVTHLVLDLPGIPLFWPFSSVHPSIALPSLGEAIAWERAGSTASFLEVLFSRAFVQTIVIEALILLPALVVVWLAIKLHSLRPAQSPWRATWEKAHRTWLLWAVHQGSMRPFRTTGNKIFHGEDDYPPSLNVPEARALGDKPHAPRRTPALDPPHSVSRSEMAPAARRRRQWRSHHTRGP